ncbi:MAG: flagellin [Armatimonadota bacterium]|nr:flagellin [bacterium]
MSLRINLNTAALTAHRNLQGTDNSLSKSIERLSSGYKINNAGDDPAGLVISEKLRAQVSGLGKAISNAGDAVNMVKTAEGALGEVNSLLRSMRDLAVHAANAGANDSAAIAADQAQITNALSSINKISEETQFGNKKLLDGSSGVKATITGDKVTSANLNNTTTLAATDTVSVEVTKAATQASITSADLGGGSDTALLANSGTFQLAGNGKTVDIDYSTAMTVTQLKDAINAKTSDTGITASLNGDGTITLKTQEYGSNQSISITNGADFTSDGSAAAAAIGINAEAKVTHSVGGVDTAISDATWTAGNGTRLQDSLGNTVDLTADAAKALGVYADQFDTVKGSLIFQVGAYAGQTREVSIASTAADQLGAGAVTGKTLADIDVTTAQGAQDALKILDQAISDISTTRANLGATQKNVLESSINSLTIAQENIQSSESSIRDTDMAAEMVTFTKNQILSQAGISMLSQANQAGQNLLSLLR